MNALLPNLLRRVGPRRAVDFGLRACRSPPRPVPALPRVGLPGPGARLRRRARTRGARRHLPPAADGAGPRPGAVPELPALTPRASLAPQAPNGSARPGKGPDHPAVGGHPSSTKTPSPPLPESEPPDCAKTDLRAGFAPSKAWGRQTAAARRTIAPARAARRRPVHAPPGMTPICTSPLR